MAGTCKTHGTNEEQNIIFCCGNVRRDLNLHELVPLKWSSKKLEVKMSTEFILFRTGSSEGLY
jgi:hypothetical protein